MFPDLEYDDDPVTHIAVCNYSSSNATMQILETLTKKSPPARVVLPMPSFELFVAGINGQGLELVPAETTSPDFKLTAKTLEQIIESKNLGSDDWLLLTSPNNFNMKTYTRKELQDIADVVARSGIKVICDELYAGYGQQPHISLASLKGQGKQEEVKMCDRVHTVTGLSKQFPQSSRMKRSIGAVSCISAADAELLSEQFRENGKEVRPHNAHAVNLLVTRYSKQEMSLFKLQVAAEYGRLEKIFGIINAYCSMIMVEKDSPAFEIFGSKESYFACFKMNERLAKKVGIEDSDDLRDYLLATAGIFTHSLKACGLKEPIVRIHVERTLESDNVISERLILLTDSIEKGKAPSMSLVRRAIDSLIEATRDIDLEQKRLGKMR